ncbi:MAG: hypothetical protein FWF08_00335 [Oscillospiraceae bacterium]|nr:hypothetical protein [Oscillospiraceae bacterium]
MNVMKKELKFKVPFSGFCGTTFINCFTSTYMFLENINVGKSDYECRQLDGKSCNSCGNCAKGGGTPISRQEKYFFLFDTMCGRSSLRCRFDGKLTEMEKMIGETDPYEGDTENNIDFLFGFAGYEYRRLAAPGEFKAAIEGSVGAGRPVIAKVKSGEGRFRVIIGYDGNKLICPDYKNAQRPPKKAPKYDELDALYVICGKTEPLYTVIDGLERIVKVMEYNISEKLWDGYIKKIGMYGGGGPGGDPDSLEKADIKEKQARLKRVAETMWHTFNCHNFGEVFRQYRGDGEPSVYDAFSGMKKLRAPEFKEQWDRISGPCCGYTHDLAWALIGLEECADWKRHVYKTGYFGEMAELVLEQIKKNDIEALDAIKKVLEILKKTGSFILSCQ